jgi:oxygen-independent coproporphyrinogen-3 oxidase
MIINIALNNFKYRYDIYQMFNLFYPFSQIIFEEGSWDYKIDIEKDKVLISDKEETKEFFISETGKRKEEIKKAVYIFLGDKTEKIFPWGTLVGIRPSKIALSLLNEGKSEDEIVDYFYRHYLTNEEKARLCIKIVEVEKRMVNKDENTVSLYIGMPFCPTRCLYCSFASNPIASCKRIVEPYIHSLIHEMEEMKRFIREKALTVQTIYFGGGTPTAVDDVQFEYIMKNIYKH